MWVEPKLRATPYNQRPTRVVMIPDGLTKTANSPETCG